MSGLDWGVIGLYFLLMVFIGFSAFKKVQGSKDFFVAGGKLPWWLSGISHHVSGYSGAVFVAYAGLAYTHGFSLYVWWAIPIAISVIAGAYIMAPRWAKLRTKLDIESPTEYLAMRFNIPTQQLIAWSGVLLKLFDVGAKWAAIGILLNGFTGIPIIYGILISGIVSLIYITVGGLWADIWTDFAQFVVQIIAGIVMFVVVVQTLGGISSITGMWDQLPPANSQPFNEPYSLGYVIVYVFVVFLSYNGGTWNLAARYISSPSGKEAKRAGLLSGILYLIWPLILFFPMWAAPIILPGLSQPDQSYSLLTQELLPVGLIGLVLASLFAATMSMTSSDANTISAVITRDILPVMNKKFRGIDQKLSLKIARITTFTFTFITLVIAIYSDVFGGVLGLLITWFAALVGPVSIPMLLGLLPAFKHSDSKAAIASILGGFIMFAFTKVVVEWPLYIEIGAPVFTAGIIFIWMGLINRGKPVRPEIEDLLQSISKSDEDLAKDMAK
ncbi:Na(+)/glucose symporter [Chlamydia abortus]|uniref:Sodium:solute symporter family protein n=1 Tax=Paenibacillus residui TaxID=629724 RepID=A0ABW3D5M7_9BACL|nr:MULTISPECIES: sodium:solute symporter family protein [Paenibacillaceae]SHE13717.1 Na(+)/glucose symporter [Chlamydia abortus]